MFLRPFPAFVLWFACLLSSAPLCAQSSLAELQRTFGKQRDELYGAKELPTQQQEQDLLQKQAKELQRFVAEVAKGDDRWNGALMLADLRLGLRDRDGAKAALATIDVEQAPGLILLTAADMLARLGDKAQRDALVARALAKQAPTEERMAMARVLMTLLREVKAGEQIFTDALAAAKDDEERALVRWHRADALRGREDLPENAFFDALDQLAKDLPNTYWGSVAKDRSKASQWKLGSEPIPFTVATTEGTRVEFGALRGRALLLVFWTTGDERAKDLIAALQAARKQHGDDLLVLGIGLDPDPAAFTRACTQLGATFLQVCDGKGWQTDLALRYGVEIAPTMIAIDRKGRIQGLNLHVDTQDARDELQAALQRALARQ